MLALSRSIGAFSLIPGSVRSGAVFFDGVQVVDDRLKAGRPVQADHHGGAAVRVGLGGAMVTGVILSRDEPIGAIAGDREEPAAVIIQGRTCSVTCDGSSSAAGPVATSLG
jgi:hypothetical protein